MIQTTSTTIRLPKKAAKGGWVILSIDEYRQIMEKNVPTYYLTGKKAKELDQLVKEGLRAYRQGKIKKLGSLADLR
mgnify:CR=1